VSTIDLVELFQSEIPEEPGISQLVCAT